MDMFEGVGRRLDEEQGSLVEIGSHSLNGRERKVLFRNNGDGTFTDVAFVNGIARQEDGRGLSILDYNNDGQIDLLLRNYKQPTELMKNTGRGSGRWMEFKLVGTISNRDAVGARIRLRTVNGWQTRVVNAGSAYLSEQSLIQHASSKARTASRSRKIHCRRSLAPTPPARTEKWGHSHCCPNYHVERVRKGCGWDVFLGWWAICCPG